MDVNRTLYEFLHNGYGLRTDLIDPILESLRKLYATLADQNKFRFYSSSLLIMYEGSDYDESAEASTYMASSEATGPEGSHRDSTNNQYKASDTAHWDSYHSHSSKECPRQQCKVDVRMIDFAHATHQGFRGDRTVHTGPDNGYLFGLENIVRMFESLKQHKGVKS